MSSYVARVQLAILRADFSFRVWLRANARLLTSTSDFLHSIALLSQSPSSEIRAEFASTLFCILQLYRDYPSTENHPYPRRVLILRLLTSVQLLAEMAAKRTDPSDPHPSAQLPVVAAIEAAKAVLRLSLFFPAAKLGKQLLASDQDFDDTTEKQECTCGMQKIQNAGDIDVHKGPRNDRAILRIRQHRALRMQMPKNRPLSTAHIAGLEPVPTIIGKPPPLPEQDMDDPVLDALFVVAYERRSNWIVRVFMPELRCEVCSKAVHLHPPPLSDTLEGLHQSAIALAPTEIAAEVAYIMRPLLHILLIRRFGWRSWKAWMLALITDLASRAAMPTPIDSAHGIERRRRMAQLLLYLGRSPFFDLVLRVFIRKVTTPLRRIPVFGGITSSAIQWITLLQQYWFYTSGS